MDKSKHTVSIPYNDYVRMSEAEDRLKNVEENLNAHLNYLSRLLRVKVKIDISKKPSDAHNQARMELDSDSDVNEICFIYGKAN